MISGGPFKWIETPFTKTPRKQSQLLTARKIILT